MTPVVFAPLSTSEATAVLTLVGQEIKWPLGGGRTEDVILSPTTVTVQVADLDFYDNYKLYALTDTSLPPPNVRYAIGKVGGEDMHFMNWTNEPIYAVNQKAPIKLDRKTLITYSKFFFHYVRNELGRFVIVEKPEDVAWLADATAEEKADVASKLKPVTYKGIGRDNLFSLECTVMFRNALFATTIKVAPYELDAFDAETKVSEHMLLGQIKLTNGDLLLEDLHVDMDPPPAEIGSPKIAEINEDDLPI